MASHYAKGAERERQVVKRERRGGWVATRVAGSHGPADVWSSRDGILCMIQVKGGRTKWAGFGRRERFALIIEAERAGAIPLLVWWPPDRQGPRYIPQEDWPD